MPGTGGGDPDRIVIVGFSAGAHLCALYSSYWNRKLLQAKGSPRQLRPNAVILGYPLADEFMNRSDMQKKLQQEIDMERITGEKKAPTPPPRLLADRRDCGIRLLRPNR